MSGYRSLHRERVLRERGGGAIWDIRTTPLLLSPSSSPQTRGLSGEAGGGGGGSYRVWAGCSDGYVRAYVARETPLSTKANDLNASALALHCTHVLYSGKTQERPIQPSEQPPSDDDANVATVKGTNALVLALGCTRIDTVRNYVGDDDNSGDYVVVSLDLGGRVRVWSFPEHYDDEILTTIRNMEVGAENGDNDEQPSKRFLQPKAIQCLYEFRVEGSTGTSLSICPPKVRGVGDIVVAVGCLDGTTAIVATGLATPTYANDPSPAGTIVDVRGTRGTSIPISLCWHPSNTQYKILAVGKQDGTLDLLTESRKHQHKIPAGSKHRASVRALSYTPDGHLLVSGSDDGLLCVWDVSRTQVAGDARGAPAPAPPALVHHALEAHGASWIMSVSCLSDSRRFVTVGYDKTIKVWDIEQGFFQGPVHVFRSDHPVYCVDAAASGTNTSLIAKNRPPPRFVTGTDTGYIQVYSTE